VERVAFLIEQSNQRLGCLLNPENLVIRRFAGIRSANSLNGLLTGIRQADNPLLFTGGGRTEITLELLFDVSLLGSSEASQDVRDLTSPFWNLAENSTAIDGYPHPPLARFIWGKSWNLPVIVVAVSQRLESFTPDGIPRLAWLRMRLLRANEPEVASRPEQPWESPLRLEGPHLEPLLENLEDGVQVIVHEMRGGNQDSISEERPDVIAYQYYGDPGFWKNLLSFNNITDPLRIEAGALLRIPLLGALTGSS
jgi:Contractile injection system tube protein